MSSAQKSKFFLHLAVFFAAGVCITGLRPNSAHAGNYPVVAADTSSIQSQKGRILLRKVVHSLERMGVFVWTPGGFKQRQGESRYYKSGAQLLLKLNDGNSKHPIQVGIFAANGQKKESLTIPRAEDVNVSAQNIASLLFKVLSSKVDATKYVQYIKPKSELFLKQMDAGYQELGKGRLRKAEYRFERALDLTATGVEPQALQAMLDVRGLSDKFNAELARSAVQTAQASEKQKKYEDSIQKWITFLKFNPKRVRPFDIHWPLWGDDVAVIKSKADTLWINHSDALLEIDLETGRFSRMGAGNDDIVMVLGDTFVLRQKNGLARVQRKSGKILWKTDLKGLTRLEKVRIQSVSGILGVSTASYLYWIDGTSGEVLHAINTPNGVTLGEYGALTQSRTKQGVVVRLYRPGRNAPAWEQTVQGVPSHLSLTGERVIVQFEQKAQVLDARNGKTRGATLQLPGIKTAPLSSGLRYVAWATGNALHIFDILAVTKISTVTGPSRPIAAVVRQDGLVVAFESSDVIHFDRDGEMQSRTLVPGRVHAFVDGSPRRPMQLLVTSLGVFALGEPTKSGEYSDFDAYLALARVLLAQGEKELVIDLISFLASQNSGNIAQISIELCRSLSEAGEISDAHHRALQAEKSTRPLEPFSLF